MLIRTTLQDNSPKMKKWVEGILRVVISAFAYYVTVQIGLVFVVQSEGMAAVWPASGVGLAILLLSPLEMRIPLLGTIFVVNASSNMMAGNSLPVSLGFALGNTLEPALGAWLLTRFFGKNYSLTRLSHVIALIGVATVANALTALIGALTPAMAFGIPYWDVWLVWWLPNGIGILLLTPLLLVWTNQRLRLRDFNVVGILEALFIGAALLLIVLVLPGLNEDSSPALLLAGMYIVFPLLTWAAMRFELHGATIMLILLNLSTLGSAVNDMGVFTIAGDTITSHLLSAQFYVAVLSITPLAMAVSVLERRQLGQALLKAKTKLQTKFDETQELHHALQEQANRDPLTGLYNRRFLFDTLRQEFSRATRENYPVSLVLVDLDFFKNTNDTHSHDAGDAVLKAVSEILIKAVRTEDIVCRYGGDEFLVVLHNTTPENATERVAQWISNLEESTLAYAGLTLTMSASAGIATFPTHGQTPKDVVKQADIVLLKEKEQKHRTVNNLRNNLDYLR